MSARTHLSAAVKRTLLEARVSAHAARARHTDDGDRQRMRVRDATMPHITKALWPTFPRNFWQLATTGNRKSCGRERDAQTRSNTNKHEPTLQKDASLRTLTRPLSSAEASKRPLFDLRWSLMNNAFACVLHARARTERPR